MIAFRDPPRFRMRGRPRTGGGLPVFEQIAFVLLGAAALIGGVWFLMNLGQPGRLRIRSEVLRETRRILVRLPENYESMTAACPLVVLLDGGDRKQYSADRPLFSRSKGVLDSLEREGFPPTILVGIDHRNRVRDLTPIERPNIYIGGGGSAAFMKFMETEVLPFVESRWRIGAVRILYGESYGGLFVLDALARGSQAFSDYIAVSPTVGIWPDGLAASFRQRFEHPSSIRSLFVIYGERDAPLVTRFTAPFIRGLEPILPSGFRLREVILPGERHCPPSSLERGLRFIFDRRFPRDRFPLPGFAG